MSLLRSLGKQILNLAELSNGINEIVLIGYSDILHQISDGLDLRKVLNKGDQRDLVELSHKIEIIKDLDNTSKEYLDNLKHLFFLEKNKNIDNDKSLLRDFQNASMDLLDVTTILNRYIFDATSDLFRNVSNSTNLRKIIDKKNISLGNMVENIEIVKKTDRLAYNLLETTTDMIGYTDAKERENYELEKEENDLKQLDIMRDQLKQILR